MIELLDSKNDFNGNTLPADLFGVSEYFVLSKISTGMAFSKNISNDILNTIESGLNVAIRNTELDIPIFINV